MLNVVSGAIVEVGAPLREAPAAGPKSGTSETGRLARRMVLFDRARAALGGERMADALGIDRRSINRKVAAERGLTDADLLGATLALVKRADELMTLARDIDAMVAPDGR